MKKRKILLLTFYYEPDLCAGSFRATSLIESLGIVLGEHDEVDIVTTIPNRYNTYKIESKQYEKNGNIRIQRIKLRSHKSGLVDQALSFSRYFFKSLSITKGKNYDLVIATSSRLFTATLGSFIARRINAPLYLDIRDIFTDTMNEVFKSRILKFFIMPVLYQIEHYTFSKASHINLVSKGFENYFRSKYKNNYSFFTNGIDQVFLDFNFEHEETNEIPVITYAGNIGEGQGLHIIIPEAAKALEGQFKFVVIGGGGAKDRLIEAIDKLQLNNVELVNPIDRNLLLEYYKKSDFLFFHLNKYKAFEKVLPSKIFEYAVTNKPLIGGVSGYAAQFILESVDESILFEPGDVTSFVKQMKSFKKKDYRRAAFIKKYSRSNIMKKMVAEIHRDFLA